ncbi:MCE family protein [Nocardioides stalactiti]|uniref:MCE family protein n=1 Tax=Nocardioides stalactiti TaxID=2755356 RepID=UPI001600FA63|nr:MlaD family protein [Nocardioides stalactiti]
MTARNRQLLMVLVGLVSVAAAAFAAPRLDPPTRHLTVTFEKTVGLYEGADVRVLGIDVGTVEEVRVEGTAVEVDISYDSEVDLPADVHAMVVAPSIVGDRFVQLAPAYVEGDVLADGAHIDQTSTAIPIELDDTFRTVQELAVALGPKGVNSDGALARLIRSAAGLLEGNGRAVNQTIGDLATAMSVLAGSSDDIDATISNLADVTATLAGNDDRLRAVVTLLTSVAVELARQRSSVVDAVTSLRSATRELDAFVAEHREDLTGAVRRTSTVTRILARRTETITHLVDLFPVGLTNLIRLYVPTNWDPQNPESSVVDGRNGSGALRDNFIDGLDGQLGVLLLGICDQLPAADRDELEPFCSTLASVGGSLGALIQQITQRGAPGVPGGAR